MPHEQAYVHPVKITVVHEIQRTGASQQFSELSKLNRDPVVRSTASLPSSLRGYELFLDFTSWFGYT